MTDRATTPSTLASLRVVIPLILACLIAITGWWNLHASSAQAVERTESVIIAETNRVMTHMQGALEHAAMGGDNRWIQEELAALGGEPYVQLAVLTDEADRVIASMRLGQVGRPLMAALPSDDRGRWDGLTGRLDEARRSLIGGVEPTPDRGSATGIYPVALGVDAGGLRRTRIGVFLIQVDLATPKAEAVAAVRGQVIRGSIALGLMVLLLGVFLHVRVTRRLRALADNTRRLARGHPPEMLPAGGRDEIGELGRGLRKMAQQRTQVEAQLRHAQKMEAVGRLASGVAHDFNNLLMGIGGTAELALRRVDPTHPVRVHLDEIISASHSGTSIVRQLLSFSRREAARKIAVPLDEAVTACEPMLRGLLGEDVLFAASFDGDGGCVRCGEGEVEQVVMNLVVNARDAMSGRGRLTLESRSVQISTDDDIVAAELRPGPYLSLSVRDTGCGMTPEVRERVFEPFFTTKQIGKGTGLGLSTAYAIVRSCGGAIDIDSAPGEGTTITVLFPRTEPEGEDDPTVVRAQPRGDGSLILVVEDESLVRRAVCSYLENAGYRVIGAASGDEALATCREHARELRLLITDTVLPGIPGREVASKVSELVPEVAIVFMSAHPAELLIDEGRLPPGTETLQKPFSEESLLDRAWRELGGAASEGGAGGAGPTEADSDPSEVEAGVGPIEEAPRSPDPSGTAVNGARVMVIDDNEAILRAISSFLSDEGYCVTTVLGPRAALELAEGEPFDLIIADLTLPGMNGVELVERIRGGSAHPPVIFTSGISAEEEEARKAQDQPGAIFLEKPLGLDTLLQAVRGRVAIR